MADPFLLLHLSDTHIGNPTWELDEKQVFGPLMTDLARMVKTFGRPPDLVVFSGDLVYGELRDKPIADQYPQARAWILRVISAVGANASVPVLLVPGNHDLNRFLVGEDQTNWVRTRLTSDQLYLHMQKDSVVRLST
jgi:3',5'-cyclic AMP phosphodiesterase CpdA